MSSEESARAAEALMGIPGLQDIDAGVMKKLEDLERRMLYRSYYFPGGRPKLFVNGIGEDTEDVHYDQLTEPLDIFDNWNPRYLTSYIKEAQQFGYHKHFLYYNGTEVVQCSFDQAANELLYCSPYQRPEIFFGIIVGLMYMDKLKSFIEDQKKYISFTVGGLRDEIENCSRANEIIINEAELQIKRVITQTSEEFIQYDDGWMATDQKYCFAEDLLDDWNEVQNQYNAYKEKLWEALKEIDSLNICSNYNSGINVGNVQLQQMATCVQKINESETPTSQPVEQPTTNPEPQPTAQPVEQPTAQPVEQPTAQPTTNPEPQQTTQPTATTPRPIAKIRKVIENGVYLYEGELADGKVVNINYQHAIFHDGKQCGIVNNFDKFKVNSEGICLTPADPHYSIGKEPLSSVDTYVKDSSLYNGFGIVKTNNGLLLYVDRNTNKLYNSQVAETPILLMLQKNYTLPDPTNSTGIKTGLLIVVLILCLIIGYVYYREYIERINDKNKLIESRKDEELQKRAMQEVLQQNDF